VISILIEAALRSLLVGLIVAVGLRALRVRNVFAQKGALGLVLVGALAMPLLMAVAQRFELLPAEASIVLPSRPLTLLEELQARILAKSGSRGSSGNGSNPIAAPTPTSNPPRTADSSGAALDTAPAPDANESGPRNIQRTLLPAEPVTDSARAGEETQPAPRPHHAAFSPSDVALSIYLAIATALLLRLVLGLTMALRLWLTAMPVPAHEVSGVPGRLRLRASTRVSSPLTIGSAILLPADYETWDKEKLRIVLAHERSHIRQGDFYLQLLAGLYAALVWFSPLGWWLKRELADLAEAISDHAGIKEARSHTSYAQILLEFAAAPRPTALGVAMARTGSLARRIERLLNDHAFRQSFANGRRALVAVVLVPVALFAATEVVRVQAASVRPPGRLAFLANADSSQTVATPSSASAEIAAAHPAATPVTAIDPAIDSQSESDGSMSFDRTLPVSGETQLTVNTGSGNIHLKRGSGSQIRIHGMVHVNDDGSEEQARQIAANPPIEQNGNVIRVGQQHEEHWHGISIDYEIEAPAGTLLGAMSGSGDIVDEGVGQNAKLETGSGDIRANGLEGPFVIKTGSGDITAEQTGEGDVKAETGSGNIEIKDIHGSFHAETGSGDIKATGTPSSPWTLETGSGNVEIWSGSAPLTLDGSTGSGSVTTDHEMLVKGSLDQHHITGNLNGGGPLVRVQTGSGDIHIH
jgi:hypothetical protein